MIQSVVYLLLAAFGLGFLIFIHELGHYWMARRVGMTVEAFAIGFGKPLLSWERKGVKWQICWLPFGGYVRIAGMEKKGNIEPSQIPDGFYGKKPAQRIKVALMGPIVNIVFAFIAFFLIWAGGGRDKPFSEFTHIIGWVDPQSKLYQDGIRPGDVINQYGRRDFQGFNDLMYSSILRDGQLEMKGFEVNYETHEKTPFNYCLNPSQELKGFDRRMMAVGILSPASYLIYDRYPNGKENPLRVGTPMADSGIQYKDRIVWADGELVFSLRQLSGIINQSKVLLTIERGDKKILTRLPRLHVSDLRLSFNQKAEFDDWQHAANLKTKLHQLFFIPYEISNDGVVENELAYINENSEEYIFQKSGRDSIEIPLEKGDRIIAVDGIPVENSLQLLSALQQRHIRIIVERGENRIPVSWKKADGLFDANVHFADLDTLVHSLGSGSTETTAGNLHLLAPVVPKFLNDFPMTEAEKQERESKISSWKKEIEGIKDAKEKAEAIRFLEEDQKRLVLGIALQDKEVIYNPSPFALFGDVLEQTWRTLASLFSGHLSPKFLSGPVGIIQVMQYGWTMGIKEALFWMAVISLNLGIINLFPLPVLDGGHICFSVIESITKKPIKAKTMERLIIPFIVLMILFFIYLTYNDLLRVFGRFF